MAAEKIKKTHQYPAQPGLRPLLAAAAALILWPLESPADREHFPMDFSVPAWTCGGAGGGESRSERSRLRYFPVIMIPDIGRDRRDWTGWNAGNTPPWEGGNVYDYFLESGFQPVELWIIEFSRSGEQMCSVEEATDDLKFFMAAVMRYTGADKVQLLAHGAGCVLARLTIVKYNLAHWVCSEVHINGPFHGMPGAAPGPGPALAGMPNAWWLGRGDGPAAEALAAGESPISIHPYTGAVVKPRVMTLRNGPAGPENIPFGGRPDPQTLEGALDIVLPGLDRDALRCARAAAAAYIPFLKTAARPWSGIEDADGDGFRAAECGGPDFDDTDPAVYPCAPEMPDDGADQDCTGTDFVSGGGRDCLRLLPPVLPRERERGALQK